MTEARPIAALMLMMLGIWHPYLVPVSPKTAAAIATLLGLFAGGVASGTI